VRSFLSGRACYKTSPFDGKSDVPIFEVARITRKTEPDTITHYRRQAIVQVVGKSIETDNAGTPRSLYFTREAMLTEDRRLLAIHGEDAGEINTRDIERYEVLIPFAEVVLQARGIRI
jgi:hypothetical protein